MTMFGTVRRVRHATRALLAGAAIGGLLAACSGEGAGAGGSLSSLTQTAGAAVIVTTTDTTTTAASIQVLKSAPTLASADGSSVTLTAIVKNSGNVGLKDQTVTFSTTDAGVRLEVGDGKTDASGAVTAKMILSDPTNREVSVTVQSGSASTVSKVTVTGTSIALSAPTSIALGQVADFSVTVRDSAGNPLARQAVSVTSRAGNSVSFGGATDAQGLLRVSVTGVVVGSDTLQVSALGVQGSRSFTVSGDQLSFQDAPAEALVNVDQTLTLKLVRNGAPQANQTLSLTATRGTLTPAAPVTNASGIATFRIVSATAGQTAITAVGPGGLESLVRMEFVSDSPSKAELQVSPAVVGANVGSDSTNTSQLIAVVRDAADNPVKNRRVNFSFVSDPSNGRIEPGAAVTDSTGQATVAFVAGPTPTGYNAVKVRAAVEGTAIYDEATLTVSRRELFVRIGTGNEVEKIDTTKNGKPYTAIVSDSSGNPVKDVAVQASLLPLYYYKGYFEWNDAATLWTKAYNTACRSEDDNQNGLLDPGEDTAAGIGNGDGFLTPGNPAVVTFTGASGNKTGADGTVDMKIIYPRDQATWLQLRLRVTATVVAGTEGAQEAILVLPGIASDYGTQTSPPPGASSPYGIGACTVPY